MKHIVRLLLLLTAALIVTAAPALAHEGREVGEYELTFGWREEPAFAGMMNGPEVFLALHDAGEDAPFPTEIEVSLQAEVSFGPETITIPMRQQWQSPGHYIADLVPTLPGDYSFRVFGTIGGTAVDELFSSADGEFSSVEPANDIMFPSVSSFEARLAALEARIAELEAQAGG